MLLARLTLLLLLVPALLLCSSWSRGRTPSLLLAKQLAQQAVEKTAPLSRKGEKLRDWQVCADCHDGESSLIFSGTHARVPKAKGTDGCETCHGPGLPHADEQDPRQITHPAKLDGAAQQQLCAQCHEAQLREHGGPLAALLAAGKKCTDCHEIHVHAAQRKSVVEKRSFAARTALDAAAKPVGTKRCLSCHGDKAEATQGGTHARFFVPGAEPSGKHPGFDRACESCHGNGEAHVQSHGLARTITRPDRARDGNATCIRCHEGVDPVLFHWKRGENLLRGATRCTDCHEVHGDASGQHRDPTLTAKKPARPASRPARSRSTSSASHNTAQGASAPGSSIRQGDPQNPEDRRDEIPLLRAELAHPLDAEVSNADCARCHADAHPVLKDTVHEKLGRFDAPKGSGCVDCHPGAGAHARHGGAPGLVESLHASSMRVQRAVCLSCHEKSSEVCAHDHGVHRKRGVTCLHCHSPAAGASREARRADANKNCASCHRSVALHFRRPHKHPLGTPHGTPLGAGELTCSSCHDPHGQTRVNPASARRLSQACADCHREYRGPFVFPHHADKGEGCLACHEPHGTTNPQLLKTRRSRDLCLSCHADLPAFHDQSPGSRYRNCLDCHTQVHGSHQNRFFLK